MYLSKEMITTFCIILCLWQTVNCENALKVVSGEEVSPPHSLPYMAALKTTINGRDIRCGGSLLNESKILTAASCLNGATSVTVILGAHNIEEQEETQVTLESSTFTIHEDYDPETHLNDIAMIYLPEGVALNENAILTISTPSFGDILKTYDDKLGLVSGWGKSNDTDPNYSKVLRKFEATIIPYLTCTVNYLFRVQTTQMCTTGLQNGKNICTGDGGDPLVVDGVQVGIASWGSDFGCSVGAPGVYTRLTSYYLWLATH